jgi:hypothetical protein
MNNKGQTNQDSSFIIGIIALVIVAVLILYFLSKLFFAVGIGLILLSIFLILFGVSYEEENLIIIGVGCLVIGILLLIFGSVGINFFEQDYTGKNLLDTTNTAINVTKDTIGEVRNIQSIPVQMKIPPSQ